MRGWNKEMKRGSATLTTIVATSALTIGGAFMTLYNMLSPQIEEVRAVQFEDHAQLETLTAAVGDIASMREDLTKMKIDVAVTKELLKNVSPNLGVNPTIAERKVERETERENALATTTP